MTKKIYLETLKSVPGRSVSHYLWEVDIATMLLVNQNW